MSANELRPGWQRVRFGDVVRNANENTRDPEAEGIERVVGLEHLDSDSLPLRRWNELADLPDGTSFTRKFKAGQVLFGKRRAYQRKVSVPDFDGICSGDILVFEPSSEVLLPGFLPYVVQSDGFFDHALGTSAGSLSPRTKWQDLAKYEFLLPPIEEQHRLTQSLQSVDRLQTKAEQALANTNSLLEAMVEEWMQSADSSTVVPLETACTRVADGPFGSKMKSEHYRPTGARVVRLQNLGAGDFVDDDCVFIDLPYYAELESAHGFQDGDLVVAGLGDENNRLGRACVVPPSILPALNKADCFLIRPHPHVSTQYLHLVLNSRRVLSQVAARARGTTRMRVSSSSYRRVDVPIPDPEAQMRLVRRARSVVALKEELTANLEKLGRLRRSFLNSELEVTHVQ
jgi:type I restriction enzyme S subunit